MGQDIDNKTIEEINYLDIVSNFSHLIGKADERWKYLYDEIGKCNIKQNDLLHEIENNKYDVCKGFFKLKELQELRKYRRQLKNEQRLLEPIYRWSERNKKNNIDIFKVRTEMDKIQNENINWKYNKKCKDISEEIIAEEL